MQESSSLSEEQREAAVALFEIGWGAKSAATRPGVRSKAVIRIHNLWRVRGGTALVTKQTKRKFTFEFKLDAVRRFQAGESWAAPGRFGGCSENTTEAGNGPASRRAICGQAGEPARKVNTERKTGALASHLPDNDGGLICADTSCTARSGMPIFVAGAFPTRPGAAPSPSTRFSWPCCRIVECFQALSTDCQT